eukprot:jgi/Ulvmu1/5596/UM023_0133.1
MLEYLAIFTQGGALLWTFGQLLNIKGDPINALIRNCLLEDRIGEGGYVYRPSGGTPYTLKWTFHNGLDLVFVAAYQHMIAVPFVDALLALLKDEFVSIYRPRVYEYKQFDDTYKRCLEKTQKQAALSKNRLVGRGGGNISQSGRKHGNSVITQDSEDSDDTENRGLADPNIIADVLDSSRPSVHSSRAAFNTDALARRTKGKAAKAKNGSGAAQPTKTKGKKPRNWDASEADPEDLDFSKKGPGVQASGLASEGAAPMLNEKSRMDEKEVIDFQQEDAELEQQLRAASGGQCIKPASSGLLSTFMSSVQTSIMGKDALSPEDVKHAVTAMQKRLQQRNVSAEVSSKICASVAHTLEGKKLTSFTGVARVVRKAMADTITRILSPPRSIDVLAKIRASKAQGKPYSIVFVGVNGVGKSTNLAKIAYWLRQQNLTIMIAACDTFRSGAVEQLKTHCNRIGVPLYDRGYDKDPTNVAAEAMRQAQRDGVDVVLIDTAGRMQDNEPLMRALSMLINKNRPDLVLFVGEALVGNDGVNQLVTFNKRLADLSPPEQQPRLIDGVLVTKFDAIDDKVGAVLSMAYSSGAPIMFVGCGQTYVDLKRLDTQAVVKSLLK